MKDLLCRLFGHRWDTLQMAPDATCCRRCGEIDSPRLRAFRTGINATAVYLKQRPEPLPKDAR